MAGKVRLTPTRIKDFKPEREAWLRDDQSRLTVRARITNDKISKMFVFDSTLDYKAIRITIGDISTVDLDRARALAQTYQGWVEEGLDPRDELRKQREARIEAEQAADTAKVEAKRAAEVKRVEVERRARYTLLALCEEYATGLEKAGKKRTAGSVKSAFKCHVAAQPEIASTPAREVTPDQIALLVRKVAEKGHGRTAGTLRAYLSAAFNQAKRARYDSTLSSDLIAFGVEHNPVVDIPAIAVRRGERVLSKAELRAYIGRLLHVGQTDTFPDVVDFALLVGLYAGGQRMAQLLRAKVSDYNPEGRTLRLWDGKGKRAHPREHLLPLGARAAWMVEYLIARVETIGGEPWLFASRKDIPVSIETPGKRAREIAKHMGGEAFDLRDVRRTVETMLASIGVTKDTRAQLLSHCLSGVQAAHYDRHDYINEKRAALVEWERKLTFPKTA